MSELNTAILTAKQRLAEGFRRLRQRHDGGCSAVELCAAISEQRDNAVRGLFETALTQSGADGLAERVALVAHGGNGRRDVAPYSDVDLMLLHTLAASKEVVPLADRIVRDVFDAGLMLGHSVRTPEEACRMAAADPSIYTSLVESRLLAGSEQLFRRFWQRFGRYDPPRTGGLISKIDRARAEERARYGETVFLLEPNIKRSRGGLRDVQLLRWIGFVRYGVAEPAELLSRGLLSEEDRDVLEQAGEFLRRLRNELHFHAGRAVDVLDRDEQLRIAEAFGYEPTAGMLPVEAFMRDYFRHTNGVSHVVSRFSARAWAWQRVARVVNATFGHRVEGGVRVGPAGLFATRDGLKPLRGNLTEIMRLLALANLYDKPIDPSTWEVVRHEAARLPDGLPPECRSRFLSLLSHPARLGPLLRDLHDVRILERFIPEFAHARGLLQFNEYHKYTVDEHCLRAVECAAELQSGRGPVAEVYRRIARKRVVHLALLIHDLGKGYPQEHHELGEKIADETAWRLGIADEEAWALKFLVRNHSAMNFLAFRRDTSDEQTVVQFAVKVGSPELLQMLYVVSAADLGAVGPEVWDGWKEQILTDFFHRTMFVQQLDTLPNDYLDATDPERAAADLQMLRRRLPGESIAETQYLPQSKTVECTVGSDESVTPGVFHRLTGALTGHGLQVRSARINTLADGVVLDRFWCHDPDFASEPPPDRLDEIRRALIRSLRDAAKTPPTFRRTWSDGAANRTTGNDSQTRVNFDNSTSDRNTIIDVFAADRPGLLYAVTRTLFELDLSVWRAKIATHLDQVVDVFYVTDRECRKIEDEPHLEAVRARLLEVIDSFNV